MKELLDGVNLSISLAKRLKEISKNIEVAEFKNVLADLYGQLATVKSEAADLKIRLVKLQEENRVLKQKAPPKDEEPIGIEYSCYKFEGDDNLYCTACWDRDRQKSLTHRVNIRHRTCPVCKADIHTG